MRAWRYHNGTKHPSQSIRSNPSYLDWRNQPLLFKVYPKLDAIPLPRQVPPSGMAALSAISTSAGELESAAVPDMNALALLLHFSAGVTKEKRFPGGETFFFRAAACTGALYEFELYLVCGNLPRLDAGGGYFLDQCGYGVNAGIDLRSITSLAATGGTECERTGYQPEATD